MTQLTTKPPNLHGVKLLLLLALLWSTLKPMAKSRTDEAEKCFCVLSAAIDVMRDHKRAAECLKLMKEIDMDYESIMSKILAKRMEV